jgi:tetratricopeptide (TPR) repeat protein
LWDFAQGYAHLRQGQTDFAELYLARVRKAAETSKQGFRFHSAKDLLSIAAGILDGELRRSRGDLARAIDSFRQAARIHEALTYDEPEPLPFAPHHWLGAALLEAKRFEEAEQEYRTELRDHPKNGWSLFGLRKALEGRGLSTRDVDAELQASWARADVWLRSSRF